MNKLNKNVYFKRWCDISLYVIISYILFYFFSDKAFILFSKFLKFITFNLNPIETLALVFICSIITWIILIIIGGAPIHFNKKSIYYIYYPPTWSIILLFLFCYLFFIRKCKHSHDYCIDLFLLLLSFIAAIILHHTYNHLFYRSNINFKKIINHSKDPDTPQNAKKLDVIKWISENKQKINIDDDLFNFSNFAEDIYTQIQNNKNITIIGKHGTGKTTILKWVEELFESDSKSNKTKANYNICWIDTWGRTENELSYYLFKKGINTLKSKFDIVPLLNIPNQFVKAMGNVHNSFNLISMLSYFHTVEQTLENLSTMLQCHNKKLVFIFEDVDRNNTDSIIKVKLPALLDRLSNTKNIHFVLTINSDLKENSLWLNKVSDYINNTPSIEFMHTLNIINTFRKRMHYYMPEGRMKRYIAPNTFLENTRRLRKRYDIKNTQLNYQRAFYSRTALGIITHILSNPRRLKHILRETFFSWQKLYGEVNYDELLILNVIKYEIPDLNNFIVTNITDLQDLENLRGYTKPKHNTENKIKTIEESFNEINAEIPLHKCHILMSYLFPGWGKDDEVPITNDYSYIIPPYIQIISSNEATNYWNRIQNGQIPRNEITDQQIFAILNKFKKTKTKGKELAEKILNNDSFRKRVLQLSIAILSVIDLLELSSIIFEKILENKKKVFPEKFSPLFSEILNLKKEMQYSKNFKKKSKAKNEYDRWLKRELIKAAKINLNLSILILDKWAEDDNISNISKFFIKFLVRLYKQKNGYETLKKSINTNIPGWENIIFNLITKQRPGNINLWGETFNHNTAELILKSLLKFININVESKELILPLISFTLNTYEIKKETGNYEKSDNDLYAKKLFSEKDYYNVLKAFAELNDSSKCWTLEGTISNIKNCKRTANIFLEK